VRHEAGTAATLKRGEGRRTVQLDLERGKGDTDGLVVPELGHQDRSHSAGLGQTVTLEDGHECSAQELLSRLWKEKRVSRSVADLLYQRSRGSGARRRRTLDKADPPFIAIRSLPPVCSLTLEKTMLSATPPRAGTFFFSE
jgi:hypothetical protein